MTVRTPCKVEVPADAKGRYNFLIGLYNGDRGRATLDGMQFGGDRILAGTLEVEREGDAITGIRFTPELSAAEPEIPATNSPGTMLDFGFAQTDGACRIVPVENGVDVIPLPQSAAFTVTLRLASLAGGQAVQVKSLTAVPLDEAVPPSALPFRQAGAELVITHDPAIFAYRVRW